MNFCGNFSAYFLGTAGREAIKRNKSKLQKAFSFYYKTSYSTSKTENPVRLFSEEQ